MEEGAPGEAGAGEEVKKGGEAVDDGEEEIEEGIMIIMYKYVKVNRIFSSFR